MSALRKQMEADMVLRGLAYRTQQTYIESVAKFYGRSPDQITQEEVQRYLLHILSRDEIAALFARNKGSVLYFIASSG